jgi:folate-binding protein YgfZ
VLLDAEQPARDAMVGWLATIAPLSACEVRDETDRWTFVAVRGAQAARALAVFEPLPDAGNAVERDGVIVIARAWGEPGFDVLGASRPDIDADDLSIDELDAARIAEGRPRFGIDFDAETHIAETPLIARAVSFTKGCYPGQESVARVQNLGRVRKRLVALDLGAPAEHGTVIAVDGSPVGAITSAAVFDGKPVAIAWLRSEVADGATVEVAGTPATVRAL